MIYAFKKGENCQSLEDHINDCLKALDCVKKTKLWRDVDEDLFEAVIVFHDVGKVFYQRESEELSFTGHEFISAYVFWKVFEEEMIDRSDALKELSYFFPIIFHHHSMGIKSSGRKAGRLDKLSDDLLIQPNSEIMNELRKTLSKYLEDRFVKSTIEILQKIDVHSVKNKIKEKIDEIWRNFHGDFARRSLRYLLIMIVCDYEGSKSRGTTTNFGRLLSELLELYRKNCLE